MTPEETQILRMLVEQTGVLINHLLRCKCGCPEVPDRMDLKRSRNAERQARYRMRRGNWVPSKEIRYRLIERDGDTCNLCGSPPKPGKVLHIDHVRPLLHGGGNEDENLQLLCGPCNWSKGSTWEA